MSAGLFVLGDYGGLIIDENTLNYGFKGRYDADGSVNPRFQITIPDATGTSIVAVRSLSRAAAMARSGNTWSFVCASAVSLYHFDQIPTASAHGAGLIVWDQFGRVVYDTGNKMLKVVASWAVPPITQRSGSEISFPLGSFGTYAVIPCGSASGNQLEQQGTSMTKMVDAYHVDGSSAYVTLSPIANGPGPGQGTGFFLGTDSGGILTVIDVSGM